MLVVSGKERFKGRIRLLFVGRTSSNVFGGVSGDDKVRVYSSCHWKTTKQQAVTRSMVRGTLTTRRTESSGGEHDCMKYPKRTSF